MRKLFLITLAFLAFFSCHKDKNHDYTSNPLELTYSLKESTEEFTWNILSNNQEISYELYASNSELENYEQTNNSDVALIFKSETSLDNSFSKYALNEFDKSYFKLFAVNNESIIASNQIQKHTQFFIPTDNAGALANKIIPIPNTKTFLHLITKSIGMQAQVIDYETGQSLTNVKILSGNVYTYDIGLYNNETVLFSFINGELKVYELEHLGQIFNKYISTSNVNSGGNNNTILRNDHLFFLSFDQLSNLLSYNSYDLRRDTFIQTEFVDHPHTLYSTINPNYFINIRYEQDTMSVFDINANGTFSLANQYVNNDRLEYNHPFGATTKLIPSIQGAIYNNKMDVIKNLNLNSIVATSEIKLYSLNESETHYIFSFFNQHGQQETRVFPLNSNEATKRFLYPSAIAIFADTKNVITVIPNNSAKTGLQIIKNNLD